ncbi:MAG: 50S ribosomal protein L23 [Clostridiaceae bacterium]|jgi:large subunit ribosomal protein L23|nr:50S ribosomal protein L23 [Clostridiaceae bacterium]
MRIAEDIIIRPYITEKSNDDMADGKYTFIVDYRAKKTEIKRAVEKLFNVKVIAVNTINYEGKQKRMGVHQGRTAKWKKAIVKIDTDPQPVAYLDKDGKQVSTSKKYKTEIQDFGGM